MRDEDKTREQLIDELVELRQRVEALTQERNLLRTLIDKLPDYIYVKDIESRFVIGNAAVGRLMGATTPDELIGKADFDFYPQELAAQYYADEREIIRSGQPLIDREEPLMDMATNRRGWISTTKLPLRESQGKIVGLVGISRDITERMRAEEALERKVEQLAALSQAAQVVTSSLDLSQVLGRIASLASAVTASDYTSVLLVDEEGKLSLCVENMPGIPPLETRLRKEGVAYWITRSRQAMVIDEIGEDGAITPDQGEGTPRLANPFLVEAGIKSLAGLPLVTRERLLGVLFLHSLRPGVFRDQLPLLTAFASQAAIAIENAQLFSQAQSDIAERRRAEEALRNSEHFARTVISSVDEGVIVYDRELRYLVWNQFMEDLTGLPAQEVLGENALDFFPHLREQGIDRLLERALAGETVRYSGTPYWVPATGKKGWVVGTYSPHVTASGDVIGVVATVRDITEQRQLEAQLLQAQKLEAVGTLAGGIAHEFNNLLTGIIGNLSLARAEVGPGGQVQQDLQSAERSARRAADLTRQLLTISRRQQSGRMGRLDINPVVEEVVNLLRQTIDRRIEINTHLAADLWPVKADPNQMSQVVMNLGLNARDAIMECLQGECSRAERRSIVPFAITIETENVTLDGEYCRAHLEAQPGQYVCLTVSDNGSGIDAETQTRIFEPFFTTKEIGRGTGLGLAMVHSIVKGHDGFIDLYSEPGMGSAFKVYLPRTGEQAASGADAGMEPAAPPTGSEIILLVDDDEGVRNAGRRILESLGYTVLLAGDGREALQVYGRERARIDLVLLDLTMPRMSGLETLHQLLQLDPGAKVILASGYSANGPGRAALAEGAAAFVQKPYDLHELALAVRAVLDD